MPNFLHYQHHLRLLRLSRCNIGGDFPNWLLENNSILGEVYLDGNAFAGSLQLPFLPNLKALDISNNKIQGQLPPDIGSIFPNLVISTMSNNMLEGLLPSSFADMKNLECLDLSYNKLNGELAIGLAREGSKLYLLRLSNNKLKGEIFPVSGNINNFQYLYLDGNNFSGPIPQKLSTAPLQTLDLSYNNLSGNIPAWLGNISSLTSLALSKNHLKGHIPPDYCRLEGLEVLDLSENSLVGVIPACFSAIRELKRVYLSINKLQGEFNMFSNSDLKVLDLRYNNFSGSIPKWLGSLGITTLLLKGNHLQGSIPTELCRASELRIMDLSHNNLSGPIPHCVGNIMQQESIIEEYPYSTSFGYQGFQIFGGDTVIDVESSIKSSSPIMFLDSYAWVGAEFMTKHNTYSYEGSIVDYMSGIDLSCNQLSGELPKELSNLTQIRALNLSYNHITGTIPSEFSNLQNIESLDLLYNNMIGRIPAQLLELTTQAVFSVAHNNLTGSTPQRAAQFATFNESSYEGNPFLCGLPLRISCMETKEIPISPLGPDCCEDDTGFLDIESFYISFLVAYENVVLVMVVVLSVNPYWRNIWFYYVESFMYSCYYFFASKIGSIPKWLGSSLEITTLLLKGNHLQGTIPTELCHASKLRIMDISHNNLSGPIPHCIGNIMQLTGAREAYPYGQRFYFLGFHTWGRDAVVHVEDSMTRSTIDFQVNYAWVGEDFTTKHNTNSYEGRVADSMAGIDLSNNQLSGEIPRELCSLTAMRALNLSSNRIFGTIQSEFSNLQKMEILI
ncbi:hypothetical protein CQW23_32762 [Capsicum baccatum]|uniref:LRR receptor-like serine/threonine-protein kinase n=1 Tax=Capsicum baccatum TaxID=33114 RepID=A0A2G2V3R8_CAPBA|nr:hypothetical protein CQW23_32762 [Capsicum baccatum]